MHLIIKIGNIPQSIHCILQLVYDILFLNNGIFDQVSKIKSDHKLIKGAVFFGSKDF